MHVIFNAGRPKTFASFELCSGGFRPSYMPMKRERRPPPQDLLVAAVAICATAYWASLGHDSYAPSKMIALPPGATAVMAVLLVCGGWALGRRASVDPFVRKVEIPAWCKWLETSPVHRQLLLREWSDAKWRRANGWKGTDLIHNSAGNAVRILSYHWCDHDESLTGIVHFGPGAESHAGLCHGGSMTSVMDDVLGHTAFAASEGPWCGATVQVRRVRRERGRRDGRVSYLVGSWGRGWHSWRNVGEGGRWNVSGVWYGEKERHGVSTYHGLRIMVCIGCALCHSSPRRSSPVAITM